MNEKRIMRTTLQVSGVGLAFCIGLFAANKHFLGDPYKPEKVITEEDVPISVLTDVKQRFPNPGPGACRRSSRERPQWPTAQK